MNLNEEIILTEELIQRLHKFYDDSVDYDARRFYEQEIWEMEVRQAELEELRDMKVEGEETPLPF